MKRRITPSAKLLRLVTAVDLMVPFIGKQKGMLLHPFHYFHLNLAFMPYAISLSLAAIADFLWAALFLWSRPLPAARSTVLTATL